MQFKIYVRALIKNSDNQVLLIQKQPNQKIAAGKWILPSGTVDFGEDPVDALSRELKEEINFTLENAVLMETETIILGDVHWLGLYYKVHGSVDTILNLEPEKHAHVDWVSLDFAKNHLNPEIYKHIT